LRSKLLEHWRIRHWNNGEDSQCGPLLY